MPAYDYRCSDCGHVFEVVQSIAAKTSGQPVLCPECLNGQGQYLYRPAGILSKSATSTCEYAANGSCCGGASNCGCH